MKAYNAEYMSRAELEALGVSCGGNNVGVHRSCVIINPEGLRLGDHVRVDAFCVLSATGRIELANYIHIGPHCSLMGGGGIVMHDFSGLSHGARIFSAVDDLSGRHAAHPMVPAEFRSVHSAVVEMKRHSGIGTGSVVMPGVVVAEGAIVGANSFVRKSLPEWTLWFGNPAKQISKRRKDVLGLEQAIIRACSA